MIPQEQTDPTIDEIRQVRRRISARFGNDPQRLVEYYMHLQEEFADRLLDTMARQPRETVDPQNP